MGCFDPIRGWRSKTVNPETGKRSVVFRRNEGFTDMEMTIPCGKCDGCAIDKAREWAVRCVGEASLYDKNCFVTLTYRDEDLPMDGSIYKGEIQSFMKALRQHATREAKKKKQKPPVVRFFACGEYGDGMGRPHYHIAIFNWDFEDKYLWRLGNAKNRDPLYRSATLEKLWKHGFSTVGTVTVESASYIARYVAKKLAGKNDRKRYLVGVDSEIDEDREKEVEFGLMSRRPGIGADWFEKFKNDCRKDFLVIEGQKYPVPKYYRKMMELYDERVAKKNKRERQRIRKEGEKRGEFTRQRLDQKEQILKQKLKLLRRGAENAKA